MAIRRKDKTQRGYFAGAQIQTVLETITHTPFHYRTALVVFEEDVGEDGKRILEGTPSRREEIFNAEYKDPTGVYPVGVSSAMSENPNVIEFLGSSMDKALQDAGASYQIAYDLSVLLQDKFFALVNKSNLSNKARAKIVETVLNALMPTKDSITYREQRGSTELCLRGRSPKDFKAHVAKYLTEEAASMLENEEHPTAVVMTPYANEFLDSTEANRAAPREQPHTTLYKQAAREVAMPIQEAINEKYKKAMEDANNNLISKLSGGAIALLFTLISERRKAQFQAYRKGYAPDEECVPYPLNSNGTSNIYFKNGYAGSCQYLREYVMERMKWPITGAAGTRARARATEFIKEISTTMVITKKTDPKTEGGFTYISKPTFGLAIYNDKRYKRNEFWILSNLSDVFNLQLFPRFSFQGFSTDYIGKIYEMYTGRDEYADELVKTASHIVFALHKEIRKADVQSVAETGAHFSGEIRFPFRLDRSYFPSFSTRDRRTHAIEVLRAALKECGITVTGGLGEDGKKLVAISAIIDETPERPKIAAKKEHKETKQQKTKS